LSVWWCLKLEIWIKDIRVGEKAHVGWETCKAINKSIKDWTLEKLVDQGHACDGEECGLNDYSWIKN